MQRNMMWRTSAMIVFLLSTEMTEAASGIQLVSHRAVYDLLLDRAKHSSVESAEGRIVFEVVGSRCEGFAQNFRQLIELKGAELGTRVIDSRSITFEEGDGSGLTFSNRTEASARPTERTDGRAERIEGRLTIKTTSPLKASVQYYESILFPMEHYAKLIETAKAGGRTLNATVFDGSQDGTTLSDTFAVIGPSIKDHTTDADLVKAGFAGLSRWPITISYFEHAATQSEEPSYSMFVELFENGVARKLRLDYGDFSLTGTLNSIDLIQTPSCNN